MALIFNVWGIEFLDISSENALRCTPQDPIDINLGPGNGLAPPSAITRTNAEPDTYRHMASLGHNELTE